MIYVCDLILVKTHLVGKIIFWDSSHWLLQIMKCAVCSPLCLSFSCGVLLVSLKFFRRSISFLALFPLRHLRMWVGDNQALSCKNNGWCDCMCNEQNVEKKKKNNKK